MKYKCFLFLLITPLLIGAVPTSKAITPTVTASTPRLGPFKAYCNDVETEIALTSTITTKTKIYEKLTFKDMDTNQTRTVTLPDHDISYKQVVKVSTTIPTSQFLGKAGMRMSITTYRAKDNYEYKTSTGLIFPTDLRIIDPLSYLENGYTTNTTGFSFPSKNFKEQFIFENYADYFLTDIYYKIPFEQFDIKVVTNYPDLPDATGRMRLVNAGHIFPNLLSLKNNVDVPITISKKGDIYRISMTKPLYVNPNNLNMASIPLSGYVATNNFYYPINQKEDLEGLEILFTINKFGYGQTTLSWKSYCYSSSSVIGECNNSEYCVVGGVQK